MSSDNSMERRRSVRLAVIGVVVCALAVIILSACGSGGTARASVRTDVGVQKRSTDTATSATTTTPVTTDGSMLAPAPTQTDPTSLWASTPIPAVAAAATAARANEPLPATFKPGLAHLKGNTYDTPVDCQPAFGAGVKPPTLCRLGDGNSSKVVVMIGDSHSGMWDPAVIADAKAQHFTMITLAKSGCQLSTYDVNLGAFSCGSWYRWALAEDHKLHPVATIVSFLYQDAYETAPGTYVAKLKTVLGQMTHPILIADMPYQNEQPATCLSAAGSTLGTCSARVPSTYVPFMKDIAKMTTAQHVPVIPTLQWFCAGGTCPMIVNDTLTVHDKDHMTEDYVNDLTGVFNLALNPILDTYEGK
jgi:hypothetical protein